MSLQFQFAKTKTVLSAEMSNQINICINKFTTTTTTAAASNEDRQYCNLNQIDTY